MLPDNSAAVLHMADQYAQFNQQRAARQQAQQLADQKRTDDLYKLVGDTFDPSKVNNADPYQGEKIKRTVGAQNEFTQYVRQARQSGKPVDEGMLRMAMTERLGGIEGDGNVAKQKWGEVQEAVKSLEKTSGIELGAITSLAMKDYFYSPGTNPGEPASMDPTKWDKNKTGAQVVMDMLDKYPTLVANGRYQDATVQRMKAADAVDMDMKPVVGNDGQVVPGGEGYKMKLKFFQQANKDAEGNPVSIDIKQEPVFLPDGRPMTNPDGSQRMTIDKGVEEWALSDLGFAVNMKKELIDAVVEENKRRQDINENLKRQGLPPMLQMVTGDSEEAKVMHSDLVLNRLRSVMQGGALDREGNQNFTNRMKMIKDGREERRLELAEANSRRQETKLDALLNGKSKNLEDIESPLITIANNKGVDIPNRYKYDPANPMATETVKAVYVKDIDSKRMEIIEGKDKKKDRFGVEIPKVKPFTDQNGQEYFQVDEATGDWKGQDGTYEADATRDNLIAVFGDKDLGLTSYNKKSQPKKAAPAKKEKAAEVKKPAAAPKPAATTKKAGFVYPNGKTKF